jgi:peptidoglycan/xylan/chitin deacetylase (PgdA/CDA1 family)
MPSYAPLPFAHGLMLHHFYGGIHPKGQGAISAEQFDAIIEFMGPERFLPAREWLRRSTRNLLSPDDLCITFDDALRCQIDIGLPVLEARGLTAFWFIYSSVFEGVVERLELYRYFRTVCFPDIDSFYDAFDDECRRSPFAEEASRALSACSAEHYLSDYAFYSPRDRKFRYLRDRALGKEKYFAIMDAMVARANLDRQVLAKLLWMQDEDLKRLASSGHVVGLHSYSHPTQIASEPREFQLAEYAKNRDHIVHVTGQQPTSVAHPCNSYGPETLAILNDMGIELGFRADSSGGPGSPLERPRVDHSDVLTTLNNA